MSMQKRMGRVAAVGVLLVSLHGQPAWATDPIAVAGNPVPVSINDEQRLFRSDTEQYIRAYNEQLRVTIGKDLKRQLTPKIELASSRAPTRS
jgi:NADPH-dependent 7-cyano-7-deazaguanine reductase QueF